MVSEPLLLGTPPAGEWRRPDRVYGREFGTQLLLRSRAPPFRFAVFRLHGLHTWYVGADARNDFSLSA